MFTYKIIDGNMISCVPTIICVTSICIQPPYIYIVLKIYKIRIICLYCIPMVLYVFIQLHFLVRVSEYVSIVILHYCPLVLITTV